MWEEESVGGRGRLRSVGGRECRREGKGECIWGRRRGSIYRIFLLGSREGKWDAQTMHLPFLHCISIII